MSDPLCTFFMPVRGRPGGLKRAIDSILNTAEDKNDLEILLQIDDDDSQIINLADSMRGNIPNLKVIIEPRPALGKDGFQGLMTKCGGKWLCGWNDDAWITGNWQRELRKHPTRGIICQPENYCIGNSDYHFFEKTGFPFFPNKLWETLGCGDKLPYPHDDFLCWLGQGKNKDYSGWQRAWMMGVRAIHDHRHNF